MPELLSKLFSSNYFVPHGHCYLWQPGLVWLHILSDSLIALAYYSIPLTLFYFVQKRRDLPFNQIFLLFSAFIVFCGTTHLMEVWTIWHPTYWLSGTLKAITALVSLYTAILLIQLMPQALVLPSAAQLTAINQELQQQIHDRQRAEARIHQFNQELEAQVNQRTIELENSMAQVQDYAERMKLAIDAARMGSWDWNLEHQSITWHENHERLFGDPSNCPACSYDDWAQRIHPDDLESVEASLQEAIATGTDLSTEYRIVWNDGSLHWLAAFGRVYYDRAGKPLRMAGIMQDITDRKQAEESFLLSEERLRLATEAAGIGMWFWNLIQDELVWTDQCKLLFGLQTNDEMSYVRFLELLHPDDRYITEVAVSQAINDRADYAIEYRNIWPDKSVHWISAKGRAFYDDRGKPIHMMGIAQDITERKQAEFALKNHSRELNKLNILLVQTTASLNQRNQELDQFAHSVSHDLKAPLRAIAHLSEWIEDDLADQVSQETKQSLELLRLRVYRMEALINGLLTYSHISYQTPSCETFALNELLDEIIDSLNIPPEFTIQIPSELPTLTTNRLLLSQVFTNLITNAIKHHDRSHGCVQVAAKPIAQGWEFAVSDDGPGIASGDHERIFGIFQTLTSRDQKESSGVGLAIVKKIIERAGGKIFLESDLGQGATFRFTWMVTTQSE
jgi:PAS domain S-box-containing protein